ncbi:CASP-like protein 1E1 [Zingiber officinale]|uniref:CASP-like protein 1E1 n=1 Tax=Zingiber officinale TaxID=94328 RepID=UPI001C4AE0A1|nr:CASP-like protein 1E1 [Zingiber officinale]
MDQSYTPNGGFDGVHYESGGGNVEYSSAKQMTTPPPRYVAAGSPTSTLFTIGLVLRGLVIVLTFISTVVMGVARERENIAVVVNYDPIIGATVYNGPYTTKSTYSSAFVYFLVANPVVFVYSVASLATAILNRAELSGVQLLLTVGDVAAAALLLSANGAAAAISVVLANGQVKLAGWTKICHVYGGFCSRVNVAVGLSTVAAAAYVLLVVFGAVNLRRSK